MLWLLNHTQAANYAIINDLNWETYACTSIPCLFILSFITYAIYDRNLISNWVYSCLIDMTGFFYWPCNLIKTDTVVFCIFHFPSNERFTLKVFLSFCLIFFANFNLVLFMKVMLNKKECTFLTAAHFIYYCLIRFLDLCILQRNIIVSVHF